jgi:hypothetical protein
MTLTLAPRSQRASSNFRVPIKQEMVGTPGSPIIRKTIKDSSTASFHKHEPVRFGYWSPLVEDILQIPCVSRACMSSSIGMWMYTLRITSTKRLNFSSTIGFFASRGNGSRCVSLMSLGEAVPRFSSSFSGFSFCLNLGLGLLFLFDWISWTHLLGLRFGFSHCFPGSSNLSLHIFLHILLLMLSRILSVACNFLPTFELIIS